MKYDPCLQCNGSMSLLRDDVEDWEYGVPWTSDLIVCDECDLVTHHPRITSEQITSLYPDNYLAHSEESKGQGVYGRMKAILAKRSLVGVTEHIPNGGTLLEVGSGNGHFLRRVGEARPDAHLVGIDIDDSAVPIDLLNFSFHHGQFEEVDIGKVDVIYCSNLIEHVADPIVFLEKCNRVLNPGGVIYGVTPNHRSVDRWIFGKYWAGYHYPRHVFLFDDKNLARMLGSAGFTSVEVRGSYSFWYLSLANRFVELPGTKKRGLPFAIVTAAFYPLDWLINRIRPHGSLTFTGQTPVSQG